MPTTALNITVPNVGDAGPGWATDIKDALTKADKAAAVSLDAYVFAAGGSFDGVFNCDSASAAAIAAVTPGGVIKVANPGVCKCSPTAWNTTKSFTLVGPEHAGMWTWWIKPSADVAVQGDAIIYFNLPVPVTVRGTYGPGVENVGIDMSGLIKAVGVDFSGNAGWGHVRNVYTEGGYRGVTLRHANAKIKDCVFTNPVDCGFYITEAGLEHEIDGVKIQRNVPGNTSAYFKIIMSFNGGLTGEIKIDNVSGTCNFAGGATVTDLAVISCVGRTEVPSIIRGIRLDNGLNGLRLTNVDLFQLEQSWLNAAAGSGFAVIMDGCSDARFEGNTYFGGLGGGCYSFGTGGVCNNFISSANRCPSATIYSVGASNKPTNIRVDDLIPPDAVVGHVTNDIAWFEAAGGKSWGPRRFESRITRRATGSVPPNGTAILVNGVVTVAHAGVAANSHVKLSRERIIGTAGSLFCTVVEHVPGVSFTIRSDSPTDNGYVHWDLQGPPD